MIWQSVLVAVICYLYIYLDFSYIYYLLLLLPWLWWIKIINTMRSVGSFKIVRTSLYSGVFNNFGRFRLSISAVCTFESFDVGSSYWQIRYISRQYGSSSYMTVIGSRSRSQEPKTSKMPIFRNVNSIAHKSGSIEDRAIRFACSMFF